MKRCIYFVSALVFFLLVLLLAAQAFLSPRIERKIEEEMKKELSLLGVEFSISECNVNLLRRNVILDELKLQWQGNSFKTPRVEVSFSFLELLLRRAICLIEVDKGEINIASWVLPALPEGEKINIDIVPAKPAETDFFVRKLRISDLFVRIEAEDDIEIPDLSLKVLLENIGMNKEANFFIKTTQAPFWIESKGNVGLPGWEEHLTFNTRGGDISLKPFVSLQDKFLPEDPPARLTDGKASFIFEGEASNGMIQSSAKISISEISVVMAESELIYEVLPEPLYEVLFKPFQIILPEPFQEVLFEPFFKDLPEHLIYEIFFRPIEEALLDGFTAGQTIEIILKMYGSLADIRVESNVSLGPIKPTEK